ncbi:translocation and assembly module TamB [Gammaproteobacteria bacterium]
MMKQLQRVKRVLGWMLALLVGLPVLLIILVTMAANLESSRRLIEAQVMTWTEGQVVLQGLAGRFPDSLRLAHLTLSDAQGPWLVLEGLSLDWSPQALFLREARVERLALHSVSLARLPQAGDTSAPASAGAGFQMPVGVSLGALEVARLELGAPVAGVAAILKITGDATLTESLQGRGRFAVDRLDSHGHYQVSANGDLQSLTAELALEEPPGGLISRLANLPELGALAVTARIEGPHEAERVHLTAVAGPLKAAIQGSVDAVGRSADLAVAASAPAMRPRADLAWQGVALKGQLKGAFKTPEALIHLVLEGLEASGARLDRLTADITGNRGALDLHAILTGTRLPGAQPDLLRAAPVDITAHALLDPPDQSLAFKLIHPVLTLTGTTRTGGDLGITFQARIPELAVLAPTLLGNLEARGQVQGPLQDLAVGVDLTGEVGAKSFPKGPLQVRVQARQQPSQLTATVEAQGTLANAPLDLVAHLRREVDGRLQVLLKRADWKSLQATADLALPKEAPLPMGTVSLRMSRLADLAPLIGQDIAGHLQAVVTQPADRQATRIEVQAGDLVARGQRLSALSLTGQVSDPLGTPNLALKLALEGLEASGIKGQINLTANGPLAALALQTEAGWRDVVASGTATAEARLDAVTRQVTLGAFGAGYRGMALRLQSPARFSFGDGLTVDRLRLALGTATLELAGRLAPALSLTATARHLTPELAKPFAPDLAAAGALSADVQLTGRPTAPVGTVRVKAQGLRLLQGPAATLPAAEGDITLGLNGTSARVDGQLAAGSKVRLNITGTAPLGPEGTLALKTNGQVDLTLLNTILGAGGRRVAGDLTVTASLSGRPAAPKLDGTLTLAHGDVQDFQQGLHLGDLTARLEAVGDTLHIRQFAAKAGEGKIDITGSVGLLTPELPVDIQIRARRARPLASDLLTMILDADLTARGPATREVALDGKIHIQRAEINLPDALPPHVAVLRVRRPGDQPPSPTASPALQLQLGLTVDAPNALFIRGRGMEAELGGQLQIGGTLTAPQILGDFKMRRGELALAGSTFKFSRGVVSFDGAGVNQRIVPALDFLVESPPSGGVTAMIGVTGYADAPKLVLSSTPPLPQDEVLAHLLFGQDMKSLSPMQMAQIAVALGEIAGIKGTGGGGALGSIRKGLGLDRLSLGSGGSSGTGASVEAGRYVAKGVYVSAKQATSGGGGSAQVQIDLTEHLKARASMGLGGGSAQGSKPDSHQDTTLGLSYGFEY